MSYGMRADLCGSTSKCAFTYRTKRQLSFKYEHQSCPPAAGGPRA
jgi:hypothetical protein